MVHACATCASTFDHPFDPASEKPLLVGRDLPCCGRSICSRCLNQNKRYETYCPYCQITTDPSPLLPQGLRDPPAYGTAANEKKLPTSEDPNEEDADDVLPAYSSHNTHPSPHPSSEKQSPNDHNHDPPAQDVLHFVTPNDSIRSLSLAYGIPIPILRKSNHIYSDHLLQARRTILIPGEFYKGGVSLSPRPVEGEEEEIRKGKVRRWMMGCKIAEYVFSPLPPSINQSSLLPAKTRPLTPLSSRQFVHRGYTKPALIRIDSLTLKSPPLLMQIRHRALISRASRLGRADGYRGFPRG
ncbi:hypothetical protein D0862_09322 [Hortaea werneckii]|uniref:LysM domain-containing protein n=1 Tax=Hortaea werneckii TaxID=91943 RepID=A0A3M7FW21_HORWE|nr:hypothetical protein D0862_09322 [Hortaea werneckii]